MPTYQYRCTQCGRDLEVVQKFSDASLTECPTCAGQLRKVFNAVGVVFKGTGFYRTDSRAAAGNGGSDSNGSSDAASTGDKSAEKTSEKTKEGAAAPSGSSSGDSSKSESKPDKASSSSTSASSTGSKAATT